MNSINSIIFLSCQKFHNLSMKNLSKLTSINSINNMINEDFDYLDEIKRQELLTKSGKVEPGQKINFKNDLQKRYYQGTTEKGSHKVPTGDFYKKNGKNYKAGDPKMLDITPAGKINSVAFDIPEFEKSGDLIFIYSFIGSSSSGNVKDNSNQRTFIRYEKLAQKASEIFRKKILNKKVTPQKAFESAIGNALDEVDVTVNCECRDFAQRFMKPAKKQKYYFNPEDYGINNVGTTSQDQIMGTGQNSSSKEYEYGTCKHIIKALANKRDRILRAKFGKDNVIGVLYDTVLNSGKGSRLYKLFVEGTRLEKKYKIKDSYSFDSIMELAKEWINSDEVNLVSGIQAERVLEDMTLKYSDELDDYSVHAGKYNGVKVCIIETPTSIYSISDRNEDLF